MWETNEVWGWGRGFDGRENLKDVKTGSLSLAD